MTLPEHLEKYEADSIIRRLLPPEGKPDGRTVLVKSLGSPSGIPLVSPDGVKIYEAHARGLLVRPPGKIVFVPYDSITELCAESVPEDEII